MTGTRLFLIGLVSSCVMLGLSFLVYGYDNTWRLWNIPTMNPYFADARVITSASESRAMGYDPLQQNPADIMWRRMNYPRIWMTLCPANVGQRHTLYFGLTFIALFLVGIVAYAAGIVDYLSAQLVLFGVFSPAVMLGVERANSDLLIFFLAAVAILLLSRNSILSKVVGFGSICVAFVLKLFPIFAFVYLLKHKRSALITLGLVVVVLGAIYTAITYDDLVLVRRGTPKSKTLSYGINVAWMKAQQYNPRLGGTIKNVSYVAVCIGFLASAMGYLAERRGYDAATGRNDRKRIDAFRVGSGIYIGTFLLGNNWDYRLMFLLFTLPQLALWAKSAGPAVAWFARIVIGAMLVSMWHLSFNWVLGFVPAGIEIAFVLDELADWTVFLGLAYLITCSAPDWLRRGATDPAPLTGRAG